MSEMSAIDQAGHAAGQALSWAWRETAGLVPEGLASFGTAGRAALIMLDQAGEPSAPSGAARSWFARWRHDGRPAAGEALVILHPDRVLKRTVNLSALAARNPGDAVRLQAATLSPIRPEDAVLAIEAAQPDETGICVTLAIARRSDIEAAAALGAARARRWRVIGDFETAGPLFVFRRHEQQRAANPVLMIALAGLAVLAALTALDMRLSRDAEVLIGQRDGLLAEARSLRAADAGRADLDTPGGRAASYPVLADVLSEAASGDEALDGASLERVRAVGRRVIVETADGRVFETQAGTP
jgi:hypothetical protein